MGENAVSSRAPAPDDELLAKQLTRLAREQMLPNLDEPRRPQRAADLRR